MLQIVFFPHCLYVLLYKTCFNYYEEHIVRYSPTRRVSTFHSPITVSLKHVIPWLLFWKNTVMKEPLHSMQSVLVFCPRLLTLWNIVNWLSYYFELAIYINNKVEILRILYSIFKAACRFTCHMIRLYKQNIVAFVSFSFQKAALPDLQQNENAFSHSNFMLSFAWR